jgi:hypothetical protein
MPPNVQISDRRAARVVRDVDIQILHTCRTQSISAVRYSTLVMPVRDEGAHTQAMNSRQAV